MYITWILQQIKKNWMNAINSPWCQVEKKQKTAYYAMEMFKSNANN